MSACVYDITKHKQRTKSVHTMLDHCVPRHYWFQDRHINSYQRVCFPRSLTPFDVAQKIVPTIKPLCTWRTRESICRTRVTFHMSPKMISTRESSRTHGTCVDMSPAWERRTWKTYKHLCSLHRETWSDHWNPYISSFRTYKFRRLFETRQSLTVRTRGTRCSNKCTKGLKLLVYCSSEHYKIIYRVLDQKKNKRRIYNSTSTQIIWIHIINIFSC